MNSDDRFWQLVAKRTISLFGSIDGGKQEDILAAIVLLNSHSADPIKFLLDSEGGSANHAFIIYDVLVHSEAPVNGLIMGKAHSGAFIISQAFKHRIAYPHATFLIHGPSLDGLRIDQKDLAENIKFRKNIHQKMLTTVALRTDQPIEKLRIWSQEERYFVAEDALKFNLIDEIVKPPK